MQIYCRYKQQDINTTENSEKCREMSTETILTILCWNLIPYPNDEHTVCEKKVI